jgi:hypothetical protein
MNPIRPQNIVIGLCLSLAGAAAPVSAHHSVAMFDGSKTITLKGTVKEFQWVNPHVLIWVNAEADNGGPAQLWAVELSSPGVLTRNGWTKRSLKFGDKVSVDVAPLRDGKPGGLFRKVTLADTGQVLTYRLQPQETPK